LRAILFQASVLLVLILTFPASVNGAKKMMIQASFNPVQTEEGYEVVISGRVFDAISNQSVPNAVLSIQVIDPEGTSVHVAIAYSAQNGQYQDSFLLSSTSLGGNYTAFLVADKPGYDTAHLTLTLAFSSPDYNIEASSSSLAIQQGQTGTLTVTILSLRGYNQAVNLTAINQPGVTIRFDPASIIPSGTSTVDVSVAPDAQLGNYTITLLGVSGSINHQVTIQLYVTQGPIPMRVPLLGAAALTVAVIVLVLVVQRSRGKRRQREAVVEELLKQASGDSGYVATARAIARLEELRALGKVDEATYQKLKKEYEKRLEESK
jgi:hypothetical protein